MTSLVSCEALTITAGTRVLVRELTLALPPGALVAVIGPNGVGKSLTLATLAGLRAPHAGRVRLGERPLAELRRRAVARELGLLLQDGAEAFPSTVLEAVLLGRYPVNGAWRGEDAADLAAARAALAALDLESCAAREPASLSGGERRRLQLARLLVQDPRVLLLDEPLNHLDPRHQVAVLRLLAGRAADGHAIVATLHDPTLAARCFDAVLLLWGDGRWRYGPAATLLDAATLSDLYATPFADFRGEHGTLLLPDWPERAAVVTLPVRRVR